MSLTSNDNEVCWYHRRFRDKGKHCTAPCKQLGNSNASQQGRHTLLAHPPIAAYSTSLIVALAIGFLLPLALRSAPSPLIGMIDVSLMIVASILSMTVQSICMEPAICHSISDCAGISDGYLSSQTYSRSSLVQILNYFYMLTICW